MNATPRPRFSIRIEHLGMESAQRPLTVVAIPVKNEVERIGLCLESLASQTGVDMAEVMVLLLLNNCNDGTAERVRELAAELPFRLDMHIVELPDPYANAGWARRLAMEGAAAAVDPDGLILTTDADTLVDCDWIEANRREIAAGVDAVAGYVMADPVELMELDPCILERGALEWEYQQLAAELEARADPEAHDLWPRHNQNCGASAAVTAAAYRRIGGLPPKRVGEDRALFEMLRRRVPVLCTVAVIGSTEESAVDPLAGLQPTARAVLLHCLGRATGGDSDEVPLQITDDRLHRGLVRGKFSAFDVDLALQAKHLAITCLFVGQ